MNQGLRIGFFLLFTLVIGITILLWPASVHVSSAIKVIVFAALITASFSATIVEHFFTKPTDVVANATAALLLFLPAKDELGALGYFYYGILAYYLFMILIASAAILIFSYTRGDQSWLDDLSKRLKSVAITLGGFKVIFGLAYFSTVLFYVQSRSSIFILLLIYFGIILALDPVQLVNVIVRSFRRDVPTAVGDIFGVQARNVFLAKLRRDRTPLRRFDQVEFRYRLDGTSRRCLIIDNYLLNEEQWIKIIPYQQIDNPEFSDSNVVYYPSEQHDDAIVQNLLGTVESGSSIGNIKFEYASKREISQGKLVEVRIGEECVLYQIVQGTTTEATLERKNKSGSITGDAAQLGVWNVEKQRFERYGWVPEINSQVVEPSATQIADPKQGEIKLGTIPGTQYPVIMNVSDAITHHLAVFGVTGSGKSVFSRWLLKQYVQHGVLVLCVDNTQEYRKKFPADLWTDIVPDDKTERIRVQIYELARQMEEFPNKRDHNKIKQIENEICGILAAAIKAMLEKGKLLGILNLPDLSSTIEGLEFTRLFFASVFEGARKGEFGERKVCIVLEEAHTLVPEWNFNSGDEKRSHALVNTIAQIALQGRKYNVGLLVIGQRTANVSKTILTQCNSVVAFQQFDPTGLEFFSHYMGAEFAAGLSVLQTRRAAAVGKAFAAGVPLIFEVPQIDETPPQAANPPPAEAAA